MLMLHRGLDHDDINAGKCAGVGQQRRMSMSVGIFLRAIGKNLGLSLTARQAHLLSRDRCNMIFTPAIGEYSS